MLARACTLLSLATALAASWIASAAPVTALVGATVWDATGAPPVEDAVVLLEGDRITAVGADLAVPKGATVVALDGKWIVPGLVDPHIHFFQSGGLYTRPDVIDLRTQRSYDQEIEGIRRRMDGTFRRYLASGVTAVVDVGGPFWNFDVREQAAQAELAPRVAVAGPLISTVSREQLDLGDPPIIKAESPEHARELVRAQLVQNPDLVKIWFILPESGDVLENIDIVEATIDEAHQGGVRVAVHATQLETARAAVTAGADILVHIITDQPVDQAFIDLLADRGIHLTTTLVVFEGYAEVLGQQVDLSDIERRWGDPAVMASWDEMAVPDDEAAREKTRQRNERLAGIMPIAQGNLAALWEAGISVNAGTDAGNIGTLHGPSVHREFQLMTEAGLTPEEVLTAATRNAARVFAAEPEFGTLEPGKLADMLILDADPLADVANLQRIHRVVLGGRLLAPEQILAPNPVDVVQRQVEAYNARDLEAFLSYYAADVELARHPSGEVFATGVEEMRGTYGEMFEQSPELDCTILDRTVSGDLVIDQEFVTGIRGGEPVRAVAIYEVQGGLIRRVWFTPKQ